MYSLSVPVMNQTVNKKNRHIYLEQFKKAKVQRVFLAVNPNRNRFEIDEKEIATLSENIAFFKKHEIETNIWAASSIGHGGAESSEKDFEKAYNFTLLTTLNGTKVAQTYCPLDENFVRAYVKWLQALAKIGAKTILIDDDFRLSQHGSAPCCCCEKHLAKMGEYCKENVILEVVRENAFKGAKNKYRDAWVKIQGDSLRDFARLIRKGVDEVDKEIRIGLCSAYSPWNLDGADALELSKILAGNNAPLLRLHGAPYWAVRDRRWSLVSVIEAARMLASFCQDGKTELLSEGDTYFRPRYQTPASYLELFDAALRADGTHHGILKYMFDYYSSPEYEKGYLNAHVYSEDALKQIETIFADTKKEGVRIYAYPHTLNNSDFGEQVDFEYLNQTPYVIGDILAECSIPTVYTGDGWCGLAFGENVKYIPETALSKGLIIDAKAAVILSKRGVDVGIKSFEGFERKRCNQERFLLDEELLRIDMPSCDMLNAQFSASIIPESIAVINGTEEILSYRYQNEFGQKFLVFTFDCENHNLVLKRTYVRQRQLFHAIEWFLEKELPVKIEKNPQLYVITGTKGESRQIALFNCFADPILEPVIQLDQEYKKVKTLNCAAELNGKELRLKQPIPAFGLVAIEVEK